MGLNGINSTTNIAGHMIDACVAGRAYHGPGHREQDHIDQMLKHGVTPGGYEPEEQEPVPTVEEIKEPPKPKRKRRTKKQIAEDKAITDAHTKDLQTRGIK